MKNLHISKRAWKEAIFTLFLCLVVGIYLYFKLSDLQLVLDTASAGVPLLAYLGLFTFCAANIAVAIYLRAYVALGIFGIAALIAYENLSYLEDKFLNYYAAKKFENKVLEYKDCAQDSQRELVGSFKVCEKSVTAMSIHYVVYDAHRLLVPYNFLHNIEVVKRYPFIGGACTRIIVMSNDYYFITCYNPM